VLSCDFAASPSTKASNRQQDGAINPMQSNPPRLNLADILRRRREVNVGPDSQEYRLRITASGNLILTK
jgi:hemin uptake protein HemP